MHKKASVFKFSSRFMVHSDCTTTVGYAIACPPFIEIRMDASGEDIAEAVRRALNESKTSVPRYNKDDDADYLKSMGFKSYGELHKNALLCSVDERNGVITILPTINAGSRDGFKHQVSKKVEISADATIEELSAALLKSFEHCQ